MTLSAPRVILASGSATRAALPEASTREGAAFTIVR